MLSSAFSKTSSSHSLSSGAEIKTSLVTIAISSKHFLYLIAASLL